MNLDQFRSLSSRARMPSKLEEVWQGFKAASPCRMHPRNAKKGEEATLLIYGTIGDDFWGDGNPAKGILEEISALDTDKLRIRINSPGGDVFDGMAIYTAIREFKGQKIVQIDGLAASQAAVIAMAGDTIEISPAAMMMIHDAWGMVMGNAQDARQFAEVLDKIDSQIASVFAAKTRKPIDELRLKMDSEAWFTAEEAVAYGLANSLLADEAGKDGKKQQKAQTQPNSAANEDSHNSHDMSRQRAAAAARAKLRLQQLDIEALVR
jgi:ATP-dependent Clp endopeptidase proteolytic subunit ClpP